jgi:transcriptional regulator with XRE-family HTH domain
VTARRTFGEDLRRARERRGIALATIAQTTKISRSLLEALERGDCSRWPGGIYNRAYVRDYAKAVGLPADDTVARFVEYFGDDHQPAAAAPDRPLPAHPCDSPPLRLTLDSNPAEHRSVLLSRARLVAIDAMMVLGTAAALTATTGADFWISAAAASLGCHAAGVLRSGKSAGGSAAAWLHRAGTGQSRADSPADEAGAASTVEVQLG